MTASPTVNSMSYLPER